MRQLILFARPGVCLVSGYVKEIVLAGQDASVVIENELWLPVSKRAAKQRMKILFPGKADLLKRMRVSNGAFICATVDDSSPELDIIIHGGEITCDMLISVGFNVRYNGNFDFEKYDNHQETHVFIGTISDIVRNGEKTEMRLSYKKNGDPISHFIITDKGKDLHAGRFAAVCGAPNYLKESGYVYQARRVVRC